MTIEGVWLIFGVFSLSPLWLIFFLPLLSFGFIAFGTMDRPRLSGALTVGAIGGSFLLSVWAFFSVVAAPGHVIAVPAIPWLAVGPLEISVGVTLDSLTAVMLVVVTSVSLLVQIYSHGYMADDSGFARYFAYMSLFTASMLGLVLADNLILLFVFWELVGVCSYLLIGFWYQRPSAAAAAKKAFITTRIGDLGFLIAILVVGALVGAFSYQEVFAAESIEKLEHAGFLGVSALTWVALGLFAGAVGKSAQFPLHVWLPDAMEGPTPVSALIHAATMVAAGVYLVARLFPLFEHSAGAMMTVAVIGGITAILAASMGLVANDIKRVMAYSTV
ncbi:MAG: NADH-quinone oxidoreductase subunit L, partial [Chloroflexi bacterium]|nr:NADH-quinone oxidoreductase subunit L [Chloroflexota bacterium]